MSDERSALKRAFYGDVSSDDEGDETTQWYIFDEEVKGMVQIPTPYRLTRAAKVARNYDNDAAVTWTPRYRAAVEQLKKEQKKIKGKNFEVSELKAKTHHLESQVFALKKQLTAVQNHHPEVMASLSGAAQATGMTSVDAAARPTGMTAVSDAARATTGNGDSTGTNSVNAEARNDDSIVTESSGSPGRPAGSFLLKNVTFGPYPLTTGNLSERDLLFHRAVNNNDMEAWKEITPGLIEYVKQGFLDSKSDHQDKYKTPSPAKHALLTSPPIANVVTQPKEHNLLQLSEESASRLSLQCESPLCTKDKFGATKFCLSCTSMEPKTLKPKPCPGLNAPALARKRLEYELKGHEENKKKEAIGDKKIAADDTKKIPSKKVIADGDGKASQCDEEQN